MLAIQLACAIMMLPMLGWPALRCVAPHRSAGVLGLLLAILLGIGMGSWVYTVLRFTGLMTPWTLLLSEGLLGALLWTLALRRASSTSTPGLRPAGTPHLGMLLCLVGAVVVAGMCAAVWTRLRTYEADGGFDALAMWNFRARFLFRAVDPSPAFHPETAHPDYPLLLPTTLARLYTWAGSDPAAIPQGVSVGFACLAAGMLAAGLARLRSWGQAMLGLIILLSVRGFVFQSAIHYADIPLSCSMLGTVLLLALAARERESRRIGDVVLTGAFAGMAAWTKNEGQVFAVLGFLAAVVFVGGSWRGGLRVAGAFLAGCAPSLVCLVIFKLRHPHVVDLLAGSNPVPLWARLMDPQRHVVVLETLGQSWFLLFDPVLLILLGMLIVFFGFERGVGRSGAVAGAMTAATIGCYYLVYVGTPHPQAPHMWGSLGRLLVQVWPSAVLALLLILRTPEQALPDWRRTA